MTTTLVRPAILAVLVGVVWAAHAAGAWTAREPNVHVAAAAALAAAPPAAEDEAEVRDSISFLERKAARDPGNADAYNRLAAYHLELLRETGSVDDLRVALAAAHASLASVPAVRNANGLSTLALADLAAHDFTAARDHARALIRFDSSKSTWYAILGDAVAELGDYDAASAAYAQMSRRAGGISASGEPRLARLAFLHGDTNGAQRHYTEALRASLALSVPPREAIAWCQWQLGEIAFNGGRYGEAEDDDRQALASYPNYFRALASLGRARAARGDVAAATGFYEAAIRRFPDPAYVASLGDLYAIAGRRDEASAQYALVEVIGRLSALNGVLYNRQLATFYADHDRKTATAYDDARREYAVRRDVYGADALAWTALKAGHLDVARRAIHDALRLGTVDARFFYHAGMIARASGDHAAALADLRRALALNPLFDPLQAAIARRALAAEAKNGRTEP